MYEQDNNNNNNNMMIKIKIQDLFSSNSTQDRLSYFYTSNKIISSSKSVYEFFNNFNQYDINEQENILQLIIKQLKTVSTNGYILMEHESDHPMRILKIIFELITQNVKNYLLFNLLIQISQLLLPFTTLQQALLTSAIQKIIYSLYQCQQHTNNNNNNNNNKINIDHLFATISLTKTLYTCKLQSLKQPKNPLIFHNNKGLQLLPHKQQSPITWNYEQGMTIMFWVYIEDIKYGGENKLPKLFTFYSSNKGGIQSYLIDNKVYYRILGNKYTEPQIGSNGINLGQLEVKKWNFVCFQHQGSKVFLKSKINFYVNKNKPLIYNIDPPKISKNTQTKIIFFDNFYGKSSSIGLFKHPIGVQSIQEYNKNINSIQNIKKTKGYLFQLHQGKLYQRGGYGYCARYILQRDLSINFNNILPFFYILRHIQQKYQYPLLNQLLGLIVLYFRKSAKTQHQSYMQQLFKIISILISCSNNNNIFDKNSIKSILHIKHTITDTQLLDQYFSDFLWVMIRSNCDMQRKQQITEIIKNSFMQNISHYRSVIGFDQMLNYLIKLQPKSISCCQKHYNLVVKKIQNNFDFQVFSQAYRTTINYILQLIDIYFQSTSINFGQQCYKLCRLLTLKFSPCFLLDLINLIKKIVNEKLNQKISQSQIKKIIKYFQQKKIYMIFLHVIENNFFAEIKAQAVKMIYKIIQLRRLQDKQQIQISLTISKALWKINQQKNQIENISNKNISPDKYIEIKKQEQFQLQNIKGVGLIQIQDQQNQQSNQYQHQYKQVGPSAPQLRNRDKGHKTFDFNFVNQNKKQKQKQKISFFHKQIIEQQKTIDIQQKHQQPQILQLHDKKKKKTNFSLSINTQQINEMYNFGGQKGQQIIVSEQQQIAQLQKIKTLAQICVNAMKKAQGITIIETNKQQKQQSVPKMMMPPPTMKNKTLQQRKKALPNLNFINEQQQQRCQQQRDQPIMSLNIVKKQKPKLLMQQKKQQQSPNNKSFLSNAKKYSTISPSSNHSSSSSQDNLLSLYNSLLQCCLSLSFQTSLIQHSSIQIPSVMCIFFKWIPQTDLQTKFLNDLDIITEETQNLQIVIRIPELYDFLFQLCYKAVLFEEMGEKRVYVDKLEKFIKKIFSHIFREDPAGSSKINFIIDWAISKKDDYHPKSLILTTRYAVLLILDSFQENLIMNNTTSDKIRQRNFQAMGLLLQVMVKFIPVQSEQEFYYDQHEKILLSEDVEIIQSLNPFFRSRWLDETACRKYFYLFKKYFSTEWYNKGLVKFINGQMNFVQIGISQLQRQSSYFLKDNFLVSIVQITRYLYYNQQKKAKNSNQLAQQIIWQLVVLVILSQTNKQKVVKNQKSQKILCFMKNLKILVQEGIQNVIQIIPIMSRTKHFLAISQMNSKQQKSAHNPLINEGILDQIISNYIPQQLLKMDKMNNIQSFRLHFTDIWIPSQNHHKKLHSQLFMKQKQRNKKIQDKTTNFIQIISNIIQEQNQRFYYCQLIIQTDNRKNLNKFRKIWQNLRLYSPIWRIPGLKLQIDTLFSKSIYSYQKYQSSKYYNYRISKHQSKAKARYFLKPRLIDDKYTLKQHKLQKQNNHINQKNDIYLNKAITYCIQNLSIGKSKLNWLCEKDTSISLDIVLPFKKVHFVNTLTVRNGYFAIINDKLIFATNCVKQKYNHLAIKQYQLRKDKSFYKIWPLEYVKQVLRRRFVNKKKTVQISFIHGKSILIEFIQQTDLDQFFKKLTKFKGTKCPNLSYISKTTDAKKIYQNYGYLSKWDNYQMSNFQYLMQLNNISGRSYSDTTQYPVMPWIIINFKDPKINISDQKNYRDLQLPMGALGSQQRISNFSQRYQMLSVADESKQKKFHYGTHYSSPGIVYHFLIRLYPFTEGAILLQSGKFDFADRLFFSIADSYKNAITEHSDVREMLPQLYTIPQVYLNINKQQFGLMQSKKRVNNVQLPEWSKENPYLFVTKLKKAFQQNTVNQHINKWIDLIFGYKQKGQQAVQNLNCFYYLTYEDSVDWQSIQDQKQIYAIQSQIMNFGQTPSQIFIKPHPQRNNIFNIKNYNSVCDNKAEKKVYRPSKVRNLLQQQNQYNPFKQSNQSIIHMKWVKDDKFVFIRRNGEMLFYKLHPPSNTASSKVPFQCAIQKQKKIQKMLLNQQQTHFTFDHSLNTTSFPIQFINKGNTICLGGLLDGKMILVDSQTQNIIDTYSVHQFTVCCIKSDSKDNFLITGDIKGNVIVWRIVNVHNTYKLVVYENIKDQYKAISSIFFSYQLKCFAVSSYDGTVFVYNIITCKKIRAYYHPNKLPINDMIISTNPLACLIIFSNQQSLIYCYSINGQLIQRLHQKQSQFFQSATLLRDTQGFEYLAYGNQKGQTIIRAMPYLDNPHRLIVAKDTVVNKICLSRNGKYLVTGCADGELSIVTDPHPVNLK